MSARENIANLLWWSVPSSTTEEAKERTEQMLDAYRAEVVRETAETLEKRGYPVWADMVRRTAAETEAGTPTS